MEMRFAQSYLCLLGHAVLGGTRSEGDKYENPDPHKYAA